MALGIDWRLFANLAILAGFWHFLAHFDPGTICDNSVTHQNPSLG